MRKIMLIGDSIRGGYEPFVRAQLEGRAEVWGPKENCGPSTLVLKHIHQWLGDQRPDIVHINCGLHDLKTEFGASHTGVSLADYRANVRAILITARQLAESVIWATTTPVNEQWHHARKEFDRFEKDVDDYNDAASSIAREMGVPIDDLHAAIMAAGRDRMLCPDGVHFTEAGYRLLADKVVAAFQVP